VNAKTKLTPAQERMEKAVAYLKHYISTYDRQYGYLDYRDETLIDDILYGLGVALDERAHQFADGFDRWKGKLREHLRSTDSRTKEKP
jgi:hypothetical protein